MREDSMAALVGTGVLPSPAPPMAAKRAAARGANGSIDPAGVAFGMEAVLRLRLPGIHSSTPLVRQLAVRVCRQLELSEDELVAVDACARIRDIGMVALPDGVLTQTGPLSPEQWEALNSHPVLGAELLQSLPQTSSMARIVRAHHERWDGQGYPDGLLGESIPLLSRVLAACDTFVAIAIDRPHRPGVGAAGALERTQQESGKQLDPQVADALAAAILRPGETKASALGRPRVTDRPSAGRRAPGGLGQELKRAVTALEAIPAFGPACERALAALSEARGTVCSDAVTAIEGDVGLTISVLRAVQQSGRRPVTTVPDAVIALGPGATQELIAAAPRLSFPWKTRSEAHMHSFRVHAQAVARAAERIARELRLHSSEELVAVALLHDVGKLALVQADPAEFGQIQGSNSSPEERLRSERSTFGLDHASVGALLLERWGLPSKLTKAVAAHHRAEGNNDLAGLVRLADLSAHYAQGDPVDRGIVLGLSSSFGLPVSALREIMFDLPHSAGSQRGRAEPSPLSKRETTALRLLAEGKRYKQIAAELGLAPSTIRTHLHNAYAKLEVDDRAQAVLRATEMAWI
jgi:putative nucleotidyltransferase with HDIG domain